MPDIFEKNIANARKLQIVLEELDKIDGTVKSKIDKNAASYAELKKLQDNAMNCYYKIIKNLT